MSQENVETFKRANDAYNRRDVEALLDTLDPEAEWHSALMVPLGGEATVYRGHEGIGEFFRDLDEVLDKWHAEFPQIRDLGDRIVAIGQIRTRGKASGAETKSPLAFCERHQERQGDSGSDLPRPPGSPRSRRA